MKIMTPAKYSRTFTSDPPAIVINRATKWQTLREDLEQVVANTANDDYLVMTFDSVKEAELCVSAIYSFLAARKMQTKTLGKALDRTNKTVVVWNAKHVSAPRRTAIS